jgi:DHA3 family macrolide efflux protein-like MFS transporter
MSVPSEPAVPSAGDALRSTESGQLRRFFPVWGGQAVSLLGSGLVQFALIWWLTETTGSATVLGLASMVGLLPQVLLGPFAGVLIDRWDRRRVMVAADSMIALATLALAALFMVNRISVWHVYLLLFVRSTGGAFHWGAMQATTPLMVPERHLSRVAGLNQTLYGLNSIATPPLSALLLTILPVEGVLLIDVATAVLAIAPLMFIKIPQPALSPDVSRTDGLSGVLADLSAGLRFVADWRGLMIVLGMAALLNLLITPGFALLPILVTEYFRGGALQLAWLESAWGLGMLAGGIVLGVWGGSRSRIRTALAALMVQGLAVVAAGLAPAGRIHLAAAALACAGSMNPIVNGLFFSLLQSAVPNEMQGRVFTLALSGSGLMSPLGTAMAGPVADVLGPRVWFLVGGLVTSCMAVAMFAVPEVLQIEERGAELRQTGAKPEEGRDNSRPAAERYSDNA